MNTAVSSLAPNSNDNSDGNSAIGANALAILYIGNEDGGAREMFMRLGRSGDAATLSIPAFLFTINNWSLRDSNP
jgi:hypothetical protein